MKKLFVTALAFVVAFSSVQAQEITERKRERHGSSIDKLGLTDDQKAKFKSANEDYRKQMEALKKEDQITVKESRERMAKLREDHKKKIDGVLTAEQKAKMEAAKKERKGKFGSKKFDRRDKGSFSKKRGNDLEKMKSHLNLSDDQVAKLKTSREAMSAEMKALRSDKTMTDEAKKEKMKEARKKQQDQLKSVLTSEQLKKLEEGRKNSPRKKQSV